jgi:hypothetical protein
MTASPGGDLACGAGVPEIEEGLCRVFALVERHVGDALEAVGVMLEGADVGPGDSLGS